MTDSSNISAQLGAAIHQNSALNATSLLERLFQGLVYPQIWEDPVVDMKALALQPGEHVFCIASGGCNAMSYLVAQPGTVTAVDLSQAEFFASFGQANRPENIAIYDRVLVARLDSKTCAYWESRVLGRRRISMFARGFHKFGLLGRFLAVVHTVSWLGRLGYAPLLAAPSLEPQKQFFEAQILPLLQARPVRSGGWRGAARHCLALAFRPRNMTSLPLTRDARHSMLICSKDKSL